MALKEINKVGVLGAGTMGIGIAQLFALNDYNVVLVDRSEDILKQAVSKMKEHTDPNLWEKVDRLVKTSTGMNDLADCDIVIEAVYEDPAVKKKVFRELSRVCRKDAIIATNTSSISLNELSKDVDEPSRFIGMHFMNPPKVMKLVEIIKADKTSEKTVSIIGWLARDMEKEPVVVNDTPGFVANRLLFALICEAIRLYEGGVASKEEIDAVMKYGANHPMGPFELADFIGLDVSLSILNYIYSQSKDEKYKPSPLLEILVKEGKLGRKTGEGFYKYKR